MPTECSFVDFGEDRNNFDRKVSVSWAAYEAILVGGKLAKFIFDTKN